MLEFAGPWDVAVVGGGMAGMSTAARLRARGFSTVVFEAHGEVGGCAGFFRRRGFSFDVGATTLVDFGPGGVGGRLVEEIGMGPVEGESLPGYIAWLPDRRVVLHRDVAAWRGERLRAFGDTPAHRGFWKFTDRLVGAFWGASRRGIKLPIQGISDLWRAIRAVGWSSLPLGRYIAWTMGDALRSFGLRGDAPLCGLLSMLVEDTVHAGLDEAPLINAALGISIRGAGLTRAAGGMGGFWRAFRRRYEEMGGVLRVGCAVESIDGRAGKFEVRTRRGSALAGQVVCALPVEITARIGPPRIREALAPFLRRDREQRGGALIAFLGVPEDEVAGQEFRHHQILADYGRPLGDGNNLFLSVSSPGDLQSAPPFHRAVMISTHCDLEPWENLTPEKYGEEKRRAEENLVALARRVYPDLGRRALVREMGTPRTYERFTRRPRGAVGGVRLTLRNANQRAIPCDLGVPGFYLAGDTTWPGLGTVACVLQSGFVAQRAGAFAERIGLAPAGGPGRAGRDPPLATVGFGAYARGPADGGLDLARTQGGKR